MPDVGLRNVQDAAKEDCILVNQSYAELILRYKQSEFSLDDSDGREYIVQGAYTQNWIDVPLILE